MHESGGVAEEAATPANLGSERSNLLPGAIGNAGAASGAETDARRSENLGEVGGGGSGLEQTLHADYRAELCLSSLLNCSV